MDMDGGEDDMMWDRGDKGDKGVHLRLSSYPPLLARNCPRRRGRKACWTTSLFDGCARLQIVHEVAACTAQIR